jgi:hypothetical protein
MMLSGLMSRWTIRFSSAIDQRLGDAGDDGQRFRLGQRAVSQMPRKRAAADIFHHDVVEPGRLVVRRVHDRDDVGMADARRELRLADETLRQRRVVDREGGERTLSATSIWSVWCVAR